MRGMKRSGYECFLYLSEGSSVARRRDHLWDLITTRHLSRLDSRSRAIAVKRGHLHEHKNKKT
jgi:hypothetical protein